MIVRVRCSGTYHRIECRRPEGPVELWDLRLRFLDHTEEDFEAVRVAAALTGASPLQACRCLEVQEYWSCLLKWLFLHRQAKGANKVPRALRWEADYLANCVWGTWLVNKVPMSRWAFINMLLRES